MPAERYFIEMPLQQGEHQWLQGAEFHHLTHVMRTREGEEIELINGQGQLAYAKLEEIRKDRVLLRIEKVYTEPPPACHIILAQALPKPNRLDIILEKGTELGVDEFWLFPGQKSMKKEFTLHQLDRLRSLTIAATKQCGRLFLPQLMHQPPLKQWQSFNGSAFFGDLHNKAPPFSQAWLQQKPLTFPIIFCVGPESGWTEDEIDQLKRLGAQGVKLHPHVLRTDTAPLVAMSLIEHWLHYSILE